MSEKPQLDVEMMKRLYNFGGLIAYRVVYLGASVFEIRHGDWTFNEAKVLAEVERLKGTSPPFPACVEPAVIQFDGVFALPEQLEV